MEQSLALNTTTSKIAFSAVFSYLYQVPPYRHPSFDLSFVVFTSST
jgi:hypothetical protein